MKWNETTEFKSAQGLHIELLNGSYQGKKNSIFYSKGKYKVRNHVMAPLTVTSRSNAAKCQHKKWSALALSSWHFNISYQASATGSPPHAGGHRADGADGGAGGAVSQRWHTHCHTLALLSFSWTGGWEANADHLVDWSKEAKFVRALEISSERQSE